MHFGKLKALRSPAIKALVSLFLLIYLAASGLSCGTQDLSLQQVDFKPTGSTAAVCRPSCSAACGIPGPQPGIESPSSALHGGFQPLDPKGSPTDACLTHSFPKLFEIKNQMFKLGL